MQGVAARARPRAPASAAAARFVRRSDKARPGLRWALARRRDRRACWRAPEQPPPVLASTSQLRRKPHKARKPFGAATSRESSNLSPPPSKPETFLLKGVAGRLRPRRGRRAPKRRVVATLASFLASSGGIDARQTGRPPVD